MGQNSAPAAAQVFSDSHSCTKLAVVVRRTGAVRLGRRAEEWMRATLVAAAVFAACGVLAVGVLGEVACGDGRGDGSGAVSKALSRSQM